MPYIVDTTNVLIPADGDYIVNGPAEIRAIKVLLNNAIASIAPFTQTLFVASNTTLTAAQSGLTVLLSTGLITLPAPSSSGITFRFVGVVLGTGYFQTPSGLIYFPDITYYAASAPVPIELLSTVYLLSDGTNWIVISQAGQVVIRPSTLANHPARIDQVLGIGQTYQDMTSSRVSGTSYYNGSTKPILVYATTTTGFTYEAMITATVGAVSFVVDRDSNNGGAIYSAGSIIVPPNTWYSLVASGSGVSGFGRWMELR